jgi:hypothetical protein
MQNNPKLNGMPPADKLGSVRKLAEERSELYARRGKIGARRAELLNKRTIDAVRASDAELLAVAARKGSDLAKVGTPGADKHKADVEAVERELYAVEGAIAQVEADLVAAIEKDAEKLRADADANIAAAQQAYAEAVAVVRQARTDLLAAATIADFFDRIAPPDVPDDGIVRGPRIGMGSSTLRVGVNGVPAAAAFDAMAEEAATAFRRVRHVSTASGPKGGFKPQMDGAIGWSRG